MSSKSGFPRIGIPCQHNNESNTAHPVPLISQNLAYVRSVTEAGGIPLLLSPTMPDDMLRVAYQNLHGLLLPGGVDVDPALYNEQPHALLGRLDEERDRIEVQLVRWAFEDELPILGICRGIQVLNVAMGGTLYQDVDSQAKAAVQHPSRDTARDWIAHPVRITPNSRLAKIMGLVNVGVNSLHHQAIKALSDSFLAVARSPDGTIEGIERPGDAFCVAVQWHPEELTSQASHRALFRAIVEAAHEQL